MDLRRLRWSARLVAIITPMRSWKDEEDALLLLLLFALDKPESRFSAEPEPPDCPPELALEGSEPEEEESGETNWSNWYW
jgi:hypothetical protein